MSELNKCRLCDLARMASEDAADLLRYRDLIAPCDRAEETVYNRRLLFCEKCKSLVGVTCQTCGCYVQIRAFAKNARCPEKKW